MAAIEPRPPVQPGEPAPDFTLPAAHGEGTVSLSDYRGTSPVLLAFFRGLYCPFCRRHVVLLGSSAQKLRNIGVHTLGIVAAPPERARLYFRFRPPRIAVGADPEVITHRSYGVPQPAVTAEYLQAVQTIRINPTGELPEPLPSRAVAATLNRLDRFEETAADRDDHERQRTQRTGQFLVDRDGIVRWVNIECAKSGMVDFGTFPTDEELLAAVRTLRS